MTTTVVIGAGVGGLATAALLAADVVDAPLLPRDGLIPIVRVTPAPALLDGHSADAERTAWWLDRLARTHAVLTTR